MKYPRFVKEDEGQHKYYYCYITETEVICINKSFDGHKGIDYFPDYDINLDRNYVEESSLEEFNRQLEDFLGIINFKCANAFIRSFLDEPSEISYGESIE